MNDYLSKPIRIEALTRSLSQCKPLSHHPKSDSSPPPSTFINTTALQAIRGLSGEMGGALLAEVIQSYLDDALQLVQSIRAAGAVGDRLRLQQAAHTLKSTSAKLGANHLAEFCRELEKIAQMGTLDSVALTISQLEAEYESVKASLQMELQQCQR
jgi:HPt (histidine-containing phosphotransfer) domain-containing protein